MQVTAKLKHFRMSARKIRLVADLIRGLDVEQAASQLKFLGKRAARPVLKLLNSAVANAENDFKLQKNNLYISAIMVDSGPTLKRWLPRAHGRATPIRKRTSHITIILDEKELTKAESVSGPKPEAELIPAKEVVKKSVEKKEDNLEKPFVTEEKEKPEIAKEQARKGWQDKTQKMGQKKGFGQVMNKIFRRKSF